MKRRLFLIVSCLLLAGPLAASPVRVRNVARPLGQRENQLTGLSLVMGLSGTGDSRNTVFTNQALSNMLGTYGINDAAEVIKTKNVAAVMVTANMGPYLKEGDKIDVQVSSLGDATSLAGGILIQTPLKGANGKVYAVAQGAISVGGQLGGKVGSLLAHGPTTTGRVPNGAMIEQEIPATVVNEESKIRYALQTPDYSTCARMAMAINEEFKKLKPDYSDIAQAKDASIVEVTIPDEFLHNQVEFMAAVEQVSFNVEEVSNKVVVNERTGTVVMGMDATIDTVAVAHGNLNVNIQVTDQFSQPAWFQPGSSALYFENKNLHVQGGGGNLVALPESATVADLVSALNLIGATPRDLITILQSIKAAGALHADLEIL
jgi:flagellar P-ring protein precursor FlgI